MQWRGWGTVAARRRVLGAVGLGATWPPGPGVPGPLPVPAETFADARSHALPLDAAQVATKRDAHRAHRTQTVVMDGFLRSLRRENERFAVVEPDAVRRLDAGAVRCPTPPGGEPPPAHVRVR